ncbi:MAG: sugar phosphate isomerase/epimerase [Chloroflexi bacterium]|nr:sugar phosphate isomerase/epimerase [Chloroflexota bacterium]
MRFGCAVKLEQIERVQEAGYDYVELPVLALRAESPDTEFEQVRERIQSYEVSAEAWGSLLPPDMKVTGPEVDKYRIERYLRTAFERIEELGGEIVVFGSAAARRVPDGFSMDEARDQIIEFVTLAGQVAGIHGITIAVAPLNKKECNIINTLSEAVELIKAADHPFVKVLADVYQMEEEGESFQDVIDAGNELVHVHTADTNRGYPGSGAFKHGEFFDVLRTIGYNDRMTVDCNWRDFRTEPAKALEFLRGLDAESL